MGLWKIQRWKNARSIRDMQKYVKLSFQYI